MSIYLFQMEKGYPGEELAYQAAFGIGASLRFWIFVPGEYRSAAGRDVRGRRVAGQIWEF